MLERVCGGSFYSFKGRFPPSSDMETCSTAFGWIRKNHWPKCTWTGACLGSAGPTALPLATVFCWVTGEWALSCVCRCRGFFCRFTLCLWALFVSVMQGWIFCAIVLCLLSVFPLFRVWVPANHESPKLMEFLAISPIAMFSD